ncbi:MAG TPA: helix-turn-helix domain-containing protein [Lacisediminihabitans sp.]|uniref:IclR family transcriptional regulator n=1 Tax=Lacisediminihabitans sp. TaxID=2787631 RepID=UPI002EDAF027
MTAIDDDKSGSTRAVDRALHLLTSVLEGDSGNTLSELARSAALSPSTASRLLATLVNHELIQRDLDGRYKAGVRMKQLAASAFREDQLYELSGHHLDQLVEETGETASLAVPVGDDEVLYLRQVASTHQVQTIVWTGRTIPREGTALGSVISGPVGERGYAASQRPDSDVIAVAVPILGRGGSILGGISINAPAYRTTEDDIARFGLALLRHGRELSRSLGAPTSAPAH